MTEVRALLFDAGNTRLKWGVFANDRIGKSGSVTHEKLHEAGYATLTNRLPRNVTHVLVCNVAGATFASKLAAVIGMHTGIDVRFARCQKSAFGVSCGYRQPRRLGVDRWIAMIGAYNEFRCAVCVVDAGTALTIDAIDKSGQHLGGQIIPGIRLMRTALQDSTSDIVAGSRTRDPGDGLAIFGKSTTEAVATGSLTAVCGAVELAAQRMRAGGLRPKIILTGGDASRILKQLNHKVIHRPNLVLDGLSVIVRDER